MSLSVICDGSLVIKLLFVKGDLQWRELGNVDYYIHDR
jgi:hypothetical protein